MKGVLRQLAVFIPSVRVRAWAIILLTTVVLVSTNYAFGLEPRIMALPVLPRLLAWFLLFGVAFWIPWRAQGSLPEEPDFRRLLLLAPAIFALKLGLPFPLKITADAVENEYWQRVLYYPFKLALIAGLLYLVWRRYDADKPFYGTGAARGSLRPYAGMLLFMVPLVALAATQRDFLALYPKWWHYAAIRQAGTAGKFLYELSYGSDFITIELFFRGFLVLAFARFAGTKAILPMAVFYCTIHFGKPAGECISSFFGGIVLGVVSYHTHSIRGGLMVHLGIAWLMELGGWIGRGQLH